MKKKEEKLQLFIEWIRSEPGEEVKFYCEKMGISKKVLWSACKELRNTTPGALVKELSKTMGKKKMKKKEEKLQLFIEWIRLEPGEEVKFYCEKMGISK